MKPPKFRDIPDTSPVWDLLERIMPDVKVVFDEEEVQQHQRQESDNDTDWRGEEEGRNTDREVEMAGSRECGDGKSRGRRCRDGGNNSLEHSRPLSWTCAPGSGQRIEANFWCFHMESTVHAGSVSEPTTLSWKVILDRDTSI